MAMHITNIGGSLTTAVCLSLIAWSIRVLRAQKLAEQKSQNGGARRAPFREGTLPSIRTSRRAYARLSPTAFWLLVEARSIRPILVDVRAAKELEESLEDDISKRLDLLRIPVEELGHVLRAKNTEWKARTGQPAPTLRATIVFVSTHGHSAAQAANIAMSLGFQRCAVIEGGLAAAAPLAPPSDPSTPTGLADAILGSDGTPSGNTPGASGASVGFRSSPWSPPSTTPPGEILSRDALLLLREYGAAQGAALVTLIDVRRHDERALYGAIRGSVHLPAEQIPRALLMTPEDWLRAFHFRKPGADEVVVVYSRRQERASYAKQLFGDAGVHRCLVLGEGVMGWRNGNEGDVRAYDAYAEGEAPPEPHPAESPTDVDRPAAEAELMHKNVLLP